MTLKQIRYYAIEKHELMNQRYGGAPYSDRLESVGKTAQRHIEYIPPSTLFSDMHFMRQALIQSCGKSWLSYLSILLTTMLRY